MASVPNADCLMNFRLFIYNENESDSNLFRFRKNIRQDTHS